MTDQEAMENRYRELLELFRMLKRERVAMFKAARSDNPTDRLLFDEVAFERVSQQMNRLDEELVELENELPDDVPDWCPDP